MEGERVSENFPLLETRLQQKTPARQKIVHHVEQAEPVHWQQSGYLLHQAKRSAVEGLRACRVNSSY